MAYVSFECVVCECSQAAHSCSFLVNDTAAQVLCLKFQGWSRAPGRNKRWRCPDCTARFCMVHTPPILHDLRCAPQHQDAAASNNSGYRSMDPAAASSGVHRSRYCTQCTSILCKASFAVCDYCRANVVLDTTADIAHDTQYGVLAVSLGNLTQMLNNLPASRLPLWAAEPNGMTDAALRREGSNVERFEDHDNLSASAMVLSMLKPLVFGIPTF